MVTRWGWICRNGGPGTFNMDDFFQWQQHAKSGDEIFFDPDNQLADVTVSTKYRDLTDTKPLHGTGYDYFSHYTTAGNALNGFEHRDMVTQYDPNKDYTPKYPLLHAFNVNYNPVAKLWEAISGKSTESFYTDPISLNERGEAFASFIIAGVSAEEGGGIAAIETNAAKGGKYAFGLKNEVIGFADKIGASHLMKDPNWKSSFEKIIANPNNTLHFTLKGIDETPMQMILTPNRSGINWELNTLYNSPAFENTIFHFGRNTYKGYEMFKIKP